MNYRTGKILYAAMWIGVVAVAFMFQVIPLFVNGGVKPDQLGGVKPDHFL